MLPQCPSQYLREDAHQVSILGDCRWFGKAKSRPQLLSLLLRERSKSTSQYHY